MEFICFFIFTAVSLVKGERGCRELDYLPCQPNKALTSHVINTIRMLAPGLEECQHQCFLDDRCVSYNLGPIQREIRSCELSDTDHVEAPDDVTSIHGSEYCPVKNPCSSTSCPITTICVPDFSWNNFQCVAEKSCAILKKKGIASGVYTIRPVPDHSIKVYCDQETDGGGWTTIQKRFDGSVNFYRGWDDYKNGFGNKSKEFWLGLDDIHILTNSTPTQIRIELRDVNMAKSYALYDLFYVGPESTDYTLQLGNYVAGNAGDSFKLHSSMEFTTHDRDNDVDASGNCAAKYKGAWWYRKCHVSNLNGLYKPGPMTSYADGINWRTWKGYQYSAKEVEMKIRPVEFNPN